jgi:hypothetical protein
MIIIDMSQVMTANLMVQIGDRSGGIELNESVLRHMILNSIRSYRTKFKAQYGELVLAFDGPNSWRKTFFPFYKKNREKMRVESPIDWNTVFEYFTNITEELKLYFPYPVIKIPGAEADDVIASLVKAFGNDTGMNYGEPLLIISGDKDFAQLQTYSNVSQFDPIFKRWIKVDDPIKALKEHIIRGDVGDGVPNIFSPDNCLVMKIRQKPIREVKLKEWLNQEVDEYCTTEELKRNYIRNKTLIDLAESPVSIYNQTMEIYKGHEKPARMGLMNYFIKNRLKNLMECVGDF